MKKDADKAVKEVMSLHKDMNEMTVDKVNDTAPSAKECEQQTKLSAREIASNENVKYIEPIRKLQPFGHLPEKWKKDHAHDWEYVKGIFENEVSRGEPIRFTFSKWPGDPDCIWEIPSNVPVYVPRMIAKHLSGEKDEKTGMQAMQYHTFEHIQKAESQLRKDDMTHQFSVTGTISRGKFRALGAFS
jgi:hypothetical protein